VRASARGRHQSRERPAPLLLAAQVAMECATGLFVRVNVLIEALVANRRLMFEREASADPCGTPLF
jgi:hypothetical protein